MLNCNPNYEVLQRSLSPCHKRRKDTSQQIFIVTNETVTPD
jgi:hypothetical protein